MLNIVEDKFLSANRGREFWLENGFDRYDYVLLLISEDMLFSAELLECFQKKLECAEKCGAILTSSSISAQYRSTVFRVTRQTLTDIMQLYCMYEFTDRLIIGAVNMPYGNRLENLLGISGFSRSETVEQVLFQV